jgi:predicted transcriptional regulator
MRRPSSAVPELPLLSPSELRIFAVLAHQGRPLSTREVGQKLAQLDPDFNQDYATVGALLLRIQKKGYVTQETGTPGKFYRPVVPSDLVLRRHVEGFLDSLPLFSVEDRLILRDILQTRLGDLSYSPA